MAQEQQRAPDQSGTPANQRNDTLRLGLIPAPELPERVASQIAGELPELLKAHTDDRHDWQVECVTDALIGADDATSDVIAQAEALKRDNDWDYVVCITDLPLFRGDQLTLAEASENRGVAVISQPALGASPLRRRLREAVLHLVNEMHHGSDGEDRERQQAQMDRGTAARQESGIRNRNARELMGARLSERLVPIQRVTPQADKQAVDVRFISAATVRGHAKLLGGMVRANRPWTIVPAFRRIVAVAFATGAYGLIFPSLWKLSAAYELYRFVILMGAAMAAMVIWLILDHGLWEPARYSRSKRLSLLYNLTTVLTLTAGVACYYAILFGLFLVAVILFVPASLLESTVGQTITWLNFPALAWLAASVATVAGALGSSLESDETIRNATYGYRQQLRHRKVKARQREDEAAQGGEPESDAQRQAAPQRAPESASQGEKNQGATNQESAETTDREPPCHAERGQTGDVKTDDAKNSEVGRPIS
ncbi:MFS transporter [Salinicola avicenniae]|uniref:MFS transporter n=1 Tax=Salinicola avicenniae TaxID=2916836 RepID=UPI0020735FFE|nr:MULTISPECIES: MFS transporter [unclassified Salinicola]